MNQIHIPVFKDKVSEIFQMTLNHILDDLGKDAPISIYDATAGYGGHIDIYLDILNAAQISNYKIYAGDRDTQAILFLKDKYQFNSKISVIHTTFASFFSLNPHFNADFIFADLGVSSPQLDNARRGFSFRDDAPLDMRMDQSSQDGISIKDFIATASASELTKVFRDYGEEKWAIAIAEKVVSTRTLEPIVNTGQLAAICTSVYARFIRKNETFRIHPATRVFQALRIYCNQELEQLEKFLPLAFSHLNKDGTLAIISFHSLEDRIVKKQFKSWAGLVEEDYGLSRGLPLVVNRKNSYSAKIIKPFPFEPKDTETDQNPRARSAKMRVIVKV